MYKNSDKFSQFKLSNYKKKKKIKLLQLSERFSKSMKINY